MSGYQLRVLGGALVYSLNTRVLMLQVVGMKMQSMGQKRIVFTYE